MVYNYNDFVNDINHGIQLAEIELKDRRNGAQGDSTITQLENYVIPELKCLLSKIIKKKGIPPNTRRDRYLTSFGLAFHDWGWDIHNPSALYLQLLKIHENYRKI